MANSLYSFNYFPLVSGSGGQDSLYSFNSCSKKHYPHGKSVFICYLWENKIIIRVQEKSVFSVSIRVQKIIREKCCS